MWGEDDMNQAKEDLPSMDDIPEAQRETIATAKAASWGGSRQRWLLGSGGAIALLGTTLLIPPIRQTVLPGPFQPLTGITHPAADAPTPTDPITPTAAAADQLVPLHKTLLGHRAYEEAAAAELVSLTADGQVQLRPAAADSFEEMAAAAAREGVILVPLSGFRSQSEQSHLFFQVKAERGESASSRAEVSAPPGYSEHHTGYALDIGDGDQPDTDVEPSFVETKAYVWLQENAARYGFELSFDQGNPQGVTYEPWHWRFVGDRDSLETFYQEGAKPEGEAGAGSDEG